MLLWQVLLKNSCQLTQCCFMLASLVPICNQHETQLDFCRAHDEISEQKKRMHRLVLRQQQQMIHLGDQVVELVRIGNINSSQALAKQANLHSQQLQRQHFDYHQHCTAMQQHIGCLQHAVRQQAVHPQPQATRFSGEKQQQYCNWLQDQLTACRSQLAEQQQQQRVSVMQHRGSQILAPLQQHRGQPSLSIMQELGSLSIEQLKRQRQQASVAELQQRAASLEAELQEAQKLTFAELQQRVSQLEGQLQEYRAQPTAAQWQKRVSELEDDLQKYRGQPSPAQWQKRVAQLEDALGKQIEQHAAAEGKVMAGVEILKSKFCSTAYDREKKLKNVHAAEVQAQEGRLRRQTLDITRWALSQHSPCAACDAILLLVAIITTIIYRYASRSLGTYQACPILVLNANMH